MKKGITAYTEYDKLGRWTLIIEKEKGKLTLPEIMAAAREHEWDYYLLLLDCYSDGEDQFADEGPVGDKVVLYRAEELK